MGLVGFLDFWFECVQLFGWPSFALGYPLCASIWAIETNSNDHMRKLIAYWILFSCITLFEYTFSKLLEWVPVWPYTKILVICWLVVPHFNGASIAYNRLVRPCISLQPIQIVVDLLNKKHDFPLEGESFIAVAERYVNENGTEALEKLIANKPKINETTVAQKEIKAVEILDESAAAAENKTATTPVADIEVKNMTLPANFTEDVFPVPPAFKNVQKEWTCAVCQVTTHSEATLNSHLQGSKHKARSAELKAGKQTETKKGVPIGGPNKERKCAICQLTTQSESAWISHLQGVKHKFKCEELMAELQTAKKSNSASTTHKSDQANQDTKKASSCSGPNKVGCASQEAKKSSSGSGPNNKFGCDICKVILQSEVTMKSHLQGTKHKSKCEQLKARETTEKDKSTPSVKKSDKKDKSTSSVKKSDKDNVGVRKPDSCQLNTNSSTIALVKIEANVSNGFHLCTVCNVRCSSEVDMASHIRGKRHLSQIEESVHSSISNLVHYWCNICDVNCKSEVDMAAHLNGSKHESNLYYDSD